MMPLLSGQTAELGTDLRQLVTKLEDQLREAREQLEAEKRQRSSLEMAVSALRQLLEPQYVALQAIFGEIEITGIGGESRAVNDDRKLRVWQPWLDKFGDNLQGKMLRALLDHGPMTAAQLRVPMQCTQQSVYNAYDRLVKFGLVSSNSGKYALKKL